MKWPILAGVAVVGLAGTPDARARDVAEAPRVWLTATVSRVPEQCPPPGRQPVTLRHDGSAASTVRIVAEGSGLAGPRGRRAANRAVPARVEFRGGDCARLHERLRYLTRQAPARTTP